MLGFDSSKKCHWISMPSAGNKLELVFSALKGTTSTPDEIGPASKTSQTLFPAIQRGCRRCVVMLKLKKKEQMKRLNGGKRKERKMVMNTLP